MATIEAIQPTDGDLRAGAAYEALMWAMAEPGSTRTLPDAGPRVIAEALIDRECTAYAADPEMVAWLGHLGARPAPLAEADYVFAPLGGPAAAQTIAQLATGTFDYPEGGAMLIVPARLDRSGAVPIGLTGPGIDVERRVAIADVATCVWSARARAIRYPLGFDMILVDEDRIVALPRSTRVEVL